MRRGLPAALVLGALAACAAPAAERAPSPAPSRPAVSDRSPAAEPASRQPAPRGTASAGIIADTDRTIWPDPVERTGVRMEVLRKWLADDLAAGRALPATLADVLPADPRDPFAGFGVDAWDHPFRYVPAGDDYELRSAGPDGRFETPDDIVTTRTKNTKMYWPSREESDGTQPRARSRGRRRRVNTGA